MKSFGNIAKDGQVRAVASGTLTDGKAVIVNADGTVSTVTGSGSAAGVSSKVIFEGAVEHTGATYDTNSNKVVFCYKDDDNSDYATAIVGTVSGDSISFGTPVVYSSINTDQSHATFDSSNNKVVISYYKNNVDTMHCIVGTVSGTNISFGSEAQFGTTGVYNAITFDSSNNKVVVVYRDGSNNNYATAKVGTVSGTSISFGSASVFMSSNANRAINVGFDSSNNKIVAFSGDYTDDETLKVKVGTVSGTSISFGSEVEISGHKSSAATGITFDTTNNKIVISYNNKSNSYYATAVVGTVSGTSISFGTPVAITSNTSGDQQLAFNSSLGKVGMLTPDRSSGNPDNYFYPLTVSGTSISAGDPLVVETFVSGSGSHSSWAMTYDPDSNKFPVMYGDATGSTRYGASRLISMNSLVTNITSENFIGFSDGAFATTQSASINTASTIDRNQSGLTAGQTYFVQTDGTLGTTAADPSVTAGTAISATELIVKG